MRSASPRRLGEDHIQGHFGSAGRMGLSLRRECFRVLSSVGKSEDAVGPGCTGSLRTVQEAGGGGVHVGCQQMVVLFKAWAVVERGSPALRPSQYP